METLSFLSTAVRDKNVGAIVPTSFLSVRKTCQPVECDRPVVVVEYGPGTGVFTRYLLNRLHPDSTVLAVELNSLFASRLQRFNRKRQRKAPRLLVEKEDARNVLALLDKHGFAKADYVISGIPFSFLDEASKDEIIARTYESLVPGGLFLVYQYSFHVRKYLQRTFDDVKLRRSLINLPPLCVMEAQKTVQTPEAGQGEAGISGGSGCSLPSRSTQASVDSPSASNSPLRSSS